MSDVHLEKWDQVDQNTAYTELHNEGRRFRDYQLSFAKWSVSLLVAIAGGYVALVEHGFSPRILVRLALSGVVFFLTVGTMLVVRHAHVRWEQIRNYTDKIRPEFMSFKREPTHWPHPHQIMYVLVFVLCVTVIILFFVYPTLRCCCR